MKTKENPQQSQLTHLFVKENITLHSGEESDFKIECDALTDADLGCIAYLISKKIKFGAVAGVPKGGIRLQKALEKYDSGDSDVLLLCDDVLNTGKSMEDLKAKFDIDDIEGVVIFARNPCPDWITPVFQLWQQSQLSETEKFKKISTGNRRPLSEIMKENEDLKKENERLKKAMEYWKDWAEKLQKGLV